MDTLYTNGDKPKKSVGRLILRYFLITLIGIVIVDQIGDRIDIKWQSPILIQARVTSSEAVQSPQKAETVQEQPKTPESESKETTDATPETNGGKRTMWAGEASWYGAKPEWCLGCDDKFIMANGERLDDTKMTLAFNDAPLGTMVLVTNVNTGKSQVAEITDTGGFNELGRIADLSVALKNVLGCGGLCTVTIETQ